jgi:hypothetical protein
MRKHETLSGVVKAALKDNGRAGLAMFTGLAAYNTVMYALDHPPPKDLKGFWARVLHRLPTDKPALAAVGLETMKDMIRPGIGITLNTIVSIGVGALAPKLLENKRFMGPAWQVYNK